MSSPIVSFSAEVSLVSAVPPAYSAFLRTLRSLECIWAPRDGFDWVLFSCDSGLPVLPIWPTHRSAHQCGPCWGRELEYAPISFPEFIDHWLCGFLPDEASIGVTVTSPAAGLLVTQHRLWADLGTSLEFLP
jgi:hypothetical protein